MCVFGYHFLFHSLRSVEVAIIDISIAIMVVSVKPWLLVPFAVLMVLVMLFRNLYLKTAKYIRMLEGVAKSPVVQHISGTLNGLSTIRAFKQSTRFNNNFNVYQNDHCSAYFLYLLGKKLLSFKCFVHLKRSPLIVLKTDP